MGSTQTNDSSDVATMTNQALHETGQRVSLVLAEDGKENKRQKMGNRKVTEANGSQKRNK